MRRSGVTTQTPCRVFGFSHELFLFPSFTDQRLDLNKLGPNDSDTVRGQIVGESQALLVRENDLSGIWRAPPFPLFATSDIYPMSHTSARASKFVINDG